MYPTLAGDRDATQAAPRQLFAGQSDVITDSAVASADIGMNQVCVLEAAGTVRPLVVGDVATLAPNKLVISQVAVLSGQACPYYSKGSFNHEALIWPAGTAYDTFAERKYLLQGSMLQVNHLI